MSQIGCSFQSPGFLSHLRWCANGQLVGPYLPGWFADYTNRILRFRGKEYYSGGGLVQGILSSSDPDRTRGRFACHSSTHVKGAWVWTISATANLPPVGGGGGNAPDPLVRVTLTDGAGFTETAEHRFGLNLATTTDMPNTWGQGFYYIDGVPKDTPLFGLIEDIDGSRMISVCVFEDAEICDTANGYFSASGYSVGSPIYDADRSGVMVALTEAWKNNAAQCFNWHVDVASSPRSRTSSTHVNVLDDSSTTFTSAIPGWTLDMQYKETLSSGGVPITFKAWASQASGTGSIRLVDSAGATIVQLSPNSSTPQWWSGTAVIPATEARYFIMYAGDNTNAITLVAASVYEYLA